MGKRESYLEYTGVNVLEFLIKRKLDEKFEISQLSFSHAGKKKCLRKLLLLCYVF